MSMIGIIVLYLLLGALAGTMAGLFGIGGGLVIVPVLIFSFGLQGISPESLPPSVPYVPTTSMAQYAGICFAP
jgi:uncharacterized membrane protein YfcA